jgi:hypothetical protein
MYDNSNNLLEFQRPFIRAGQAACNDICFSPLQQPTPCVAHVELLGEVRHKAGSLAVSVTKKSPTSPQRSLPTNGKAKEITV